eukprot:7391594-Prymnesium_polylepis.1
MAAGAHLGTGASVLLLEVVLGVEALHDGGDVLVRAVGLAWNHHAQLLHSKLGLLRLAELLLGGLGLGAAARRRRAARRGRRCPGQAQALLQPLTDGPRYIAVRLRGVGGQSHRQRRPPTPARRSSHPLSRPRLAMHAAAPPRGAALRPGTRRAPAIRRGRSEYGWVYQRQG